MGILSSYNIEILDPTLVLHYPPQMPLSRLLVLAHFIDGEAEARRELSHREARGALLLCRFSQPSPPPG